MQRSLTIVKYYDEFHTLSSRVEVDEPEYITVKRCKRGFHKATRDIMRLSPINTIVDAFQAAISVESLLAT